MEYPWSRGVLKDWDIVGMNHYRLLGKKRLFVAMTKDSRCIKAEGPDDETVWEKMVAQAMQMS